MTNRIVMGLDPGLANYGWCAVDVTGHRKTEAVKAALKKAREAYRR